MSLCRLRTPVVTAHFWSPDNPHPAQEEAHEKDGVVIRVYALGSGEKRRRYLKDGDVILPTSLSAVFTVMCKADFERQYEVIG